MADGGKVDSLSPEGGKVDSLSPEPQELLIPEYIQHGNSCRLLTVIKQVRIIEKNTAKAFKDEKREETLTQKDAWTLMFIAALAIIAKTWKQPKCPLTEEWIKKMWYIYNRVLLSHKKNEIMSLAATRMYLEMIILNEVSLTKTKYHRIPLLCGI